jgi:hypothetical protein
LPIQPLEQLEQSEPIPKPVRFNWADEV